MKRNPFIILALTVALTVPSATGVMADTADIQGDREEISVITDEEEITDTSKLEEDKQDIFESEENEEDKEESKDDKEGTDDPKQDVRDDREPSGPEEQIEVSEEEIRQKEDTEALEEDGSLLEDEEDESEEDVSEDTDDDDEDDGKKKKETREGPPQFSSPLPTPSLTGDWRDDFVNIAKSQIGYREASDGSTYFGNRSGIPYGAWCTAFVSWCAASAGMPKKALPRVLNSTKYIEFYAPQGRFRYVKGGVDAADATFMKGIDQDDIKTIKPSSIKPGDIVLFDTDRNPNDGPDHTAIFIGLSEDGKGVINLSGNSNNSVNITTKSISTVYGICRPIFDKEEFAPEAVSIKTVKNTKSGIKIKWDTFDDASGYEVYAKRLNDPGSDGYVQQTDPASVYNEGSWVFENVSNGDKIKFYVRAYSTVSDDDPGERVYSSKSEKKKQIYIKRAKIKNALSDKNNSITIDWKKNDKCTGYQIQLSTKEDFESHKTLTIMSNDKTSKTIGRLEKGRTYYIRIRAYKRVKDTDYYGAWAKYDEGVTVR